LFGKRDDVLGQRRFVICPARHLALRRQMLAKHPAYTPLGYPNTITANIVLMNLILAPFEMAPVPAFPPIGASRIIAYPYTRGLASDFCFSAVKWLTAHVRTYEDEWPSI